MIATASAMTTTKGRPDPGSLPVGVVSSGSRGECGTNRQGGERGEWLGYFLVFLLLFILIVLFSYNILYSVIILKL